MIKSYNQFNELAKFKPINSINDIEDYCYEAGIENYHINKDMSVDILNGGVIITWVSGGFLPLKFNKVQNYFKVANTGLKSLEGCPIEVGGYFSCTLNNLKSLKGMPSFVGGGIYCNDNELESLEYLPKVINGNINCSHNNIRSFKGISEDFNGHFICSLNPIDEIYKLFLFKSKAIYWINEFDVIRDDKYISIERLEEVFLQLDMEVPEINEIKGYNLV